MAVEWVIQVWRPHGNHTAEWKQGAILTGTVHLLCSPRMLAASRERRKSKRMPRLFDRDPQMRPGNGRSQQTDLRKADSLIGRQSARRHNVELPLARVTMVGAVIAKPGGMRTRKCAPVDPRAVSKSHHRSSRFALGYRSSAARVLQVLPMSAGPLIALPPSGSRCGAQNPAAPVGRTQPPFRSEGFADDDFDNRPGKSFQSSACRKRFRWPGLGYRQRSGSPSCALANPPAQKARPIRRATRPARTGTRLNHVIFRRYRRT